MDAGQVLNYQYTGSKQTVALPAGIYKLEVWGAQGGSYSGGTGGKGGYSVGTLSVPKDITAYVYVGQKPTSTTGGFNGGSNTSSYGSGGGGATDIRLVQDSLYARVIVAGGGGSNGYGSANQGGYGGGTTGGQGANGSYAGGKGGTQTVGGACYSSSGNGKFGAGGYMSTNGGGAGGGWYGGGHGYSGGTDSAGGGGSGFVWTGANAPSGYLLGAEYHLTDAKTVAGNASMPSINGGTMTGNAAHGHARITCLQVGFKPDAPTTLVADSTQNTVMLSWSAVSDVTGYKIYRGTQLLSTQTGLTYTDSGLTPNTQYSYKVTAYDNNGESDPKEITVSTKEWQVENLRQTAKDYTSLAIGWSGSDIATGYKIYRDDKLVSDQTTTTYIDKGLLPDEEHVYKVQAYNANSSSAFAEITARTEWAIYINGAVIERCVLIPNPAQINSKVTLKVFAQDKLIISENNHSGELYAGEV